VGDRLVKFWTPEPETLGNSQISRAGSVFEAGMHEKDGSHVFFRNTHVGAG